MMESSSPADGAPPQQQAIPSAPSSTNNIATLSTNNRRANASLVVRCIRTFLLVVICTLCFVLFKIAVEGGADESYDLLNFETSTESSSNSSISISDNVGGGGGGDPTAKSTGGTRKKDKVKSLLYIVTSSSQFNKARKRHMQHQDTDRLKHGIIPVLKESTENMIGAGFDVDLYLVLSYELNSTRLALVQDALPEGVNLEVWDNASPYYYDEGYKNKRTPDKVKELNRALSRQHRFVVRDKLFDYDFFCAFEDDMLITGDHLLHHLWMSEQLEKMKQQALEKTTQHQYGIGSKEIWFGDMTKKQFSHIRPGFVRVEVALDEAQDPLQTEADVENVPIDHDFSDMGYGTNEVVDPAICCHVRHVGGNGTKAPPDPDSSKLMLWETGISGLGVREMPDGSWVASLPGPRQFLKDNFDYKVGNFMALESKRTLKIKPNGANPRYLAQSAGWMMTRRQLIEMHIDLCKGSFMPPFHAPSFINDGLYMMNVEYWSGGLQMWCPNKGCNIQRIIQLDPKNFSKHLLYHTSNNKQKQIVRERRVRMNDLQGQLNTLRKDAIEAKRIAMLKKK